MLFVIFSHNLLKVSAFFDNVDDMLRYSKTSPNISPHTPPKLCPLTRRNVTSSMTNSQSSDAYTTHSSFTSNTSTRAFSMHITPDNNSSPTTKHTSPHPTRPNIPKPSARTHITPYISTYTRQQRLPTPSTHRITSCQFTQNMKHGSQN